LIHSQKIDTHLLIHMNANHWHWHHHDRGGHDHYGMTLMPVASAVDQAAGSSDEGDGAGKQQDQFHIRIFGHFLGDGTRETGTSLWGETLSGGRRYNHLQRYLDGLRIRSRRSASCSSMTVCCALALEALAMV